ncbi:MAG: hypothetical protein A4E56_00155 [Pelotomaculum sp. PtaU1.Bin065]|nr:MAG: hypothetical protein A4E56_00155 [Pelotomaculum sp. PtaU1.Bin065]
MVCHTTQNAIICAESKLTLEEQEIIKEDIQRYLEEKKANSKRLTTYDDGEARVLGIGHKIAFAKLAAYEDNGLSPEEVRALLDKIAEAVAGSKTHGLTQKEVLDFVFNGELKADLDKLSEYESTGLSPGEVNEPIKLAQNEIVAPAAVQNMVARAVKKARQKYNHAEAFCLMTYQCESCGCEERIWNSRDGVTPFVLRCRYCGGEAKHVRWNEDRCVPEYIPKPGERVFKNMTHEKAREIAEARLARRSRFEVSADEREEVIRAIIDECMMGPMLVEIK